MRIGVVGNQVARLIPCREKLFALLVVDVAADHEERCLSGMRAQSFEDRLIALSAR